MLAIFKFSNQNGEDSSDLSRKVASIMIVGEKMELIEPYIRKIAHLLEYAVGGILFLAMFLTYEMSDRKRMIGSLIIGMEYAALDEIHQLFIDGRAGQVKDVLIDTIGVAIGICFLMICYKIRQKRKDGV